MLLRSCVLWSFAYFLLKDPGAIAANRYVVVMAQSMRIPHVVVRDDDPMIGLVAFLLAILGICDIPPLFGHYIEYLETNVPIRLCGYFFICIYGYHVYNPYLSNSIVFCFGFVEVVFNFLIYSSVREDRNEQRGIELRRMAAEEYGFNS